MVNLTIKLIVKKTFSTLDFIRVSENANSATAIS